MFSKMFSFSAEISKIKKRTQCGFYFQYSSKIFQYYGVKTFPAGDMKRCYLQKKIFQTIGDFKKALVGVTWYS